MLEGKFIPCGAVVEGNHMLQGDGGTAPTHQHSTAMWGGMEPKAGAHAGKWSSWDSEECHTAWGLYQWPVPCLVQPLCHVTSTGMTPRGLDVGQH